MHFQDLCSLCLSIKYTNISFSTQSQTFHLTSLQRFSHIFVIQYSHKCSFPILFGASPCRKYKNFLHLEVFGLPTLFELSCQLISWVQPGPMACVSCLIGFRYVEPLFSFISYPFVFYISYLHFVTFSIRHTLSIILLKEVSVIRSYWNVCDPVVFAHLQCGIDPRTLGRMECHVIDVNSAPDESAKESSHFHVHGSHLWHHLLGLSLLALADFAYM